MIKSKLAIGVVGLGYIGAYHARGLQESKNCRLVAGIDPLQKKRAVFSSKHEDVSTFASLEAALQKTRLDAIVIATPNYLHKPLSIQAMDAGLHVLVDKPMAMSAAEGEEMIRCARKNKVKLSVGHMWRFDHQARYLENQIKAGTLGSIVRTNGWGVHKRWGPTGWFTQKSKAGGGALIDMGVHAIDTARFILGDPEPASVYSRLSTNYGGYDVDDTGLTVINWKDGSVSTVESGWWQPYIGGLEASTKIFGTKGYARLFPTSMITADGKKKRNPAFPQKKEHCDQSLYSAQADDFALSIINDREPVASAEAGLIVMKICDAAYVSSVENRLVCLGDDQ